MVTVADITVGDITVADMDPEYTEGHCMDLGSTEDYMDLDLIIPDTMAAIITGMDLDTSSDKKFQ